jgi:hypothetical protein
MSRTQRGFGRWPGRVAVLLLAAAFGTMPGAFGQEQDEGAEAVRPVKRFYFGGHFSYLGIPVTQGGTLLEASSGDPAFRTEIKGTASGSKWGAGASFQVNLNRKLGVLLEFTPRNAGYKVVQTTTMGLNDTDTSWDERASYKATQVSRADHWDFAAMARLYYAHRERASFRRFFSFGGTYRRLADIRSSAESTLTYGATSSSETPDTVQCCDETPLTPRHKSVAGFALGAGVQAMDDLGIKVIPEVRFTRWLSSAFDVPPARSSKNQWELILSIVF